MFGTNGATAGILGSAAVAIKVHGIRSSDQLELVGLPFRGNVRVGKKIMFT